MPQLADLIAGWTGANPTITGLTADSRKVAPGFLFAALPGTKADGRAFIDRAVAAGAVAILAPEGTPAPAGAVLVTQPEPRRAFALAAAAFHGRQPAHMAAVTGTNGKTSTANFARQLWRALGHRAAALGTLGVIAEDWPHEGSLTTPDPADLHTTLAGLADHGITHACMEASSHGLAQFRLDGVRLEAAAFTNLTRDHLDYHGTMEEYGAAKLRLFTELLPATGTAIVNADSPVADLFLKAAKGRGQPILAYGVHGADLRLKAAHAAPDGQVLDLDILGRPARIHLKLAGTFQAANALAALGLVIACGADAAAATAALEGLDGVPGRLQPVAPSIFVDYAHTPDALETVLNALRPHAHGRLVVVFGCGGDRDPGKRPQMGAIAARLADRVIITDDNPRTEAAAPIRAAILAACPDAVEIADRRAAIRAAIAGMEAGDVLVVAGKGHEQGQIVGTEILPFDDATECRAALDRRAP
ncbi:UDP-N-acetylmuramoyl-L-alanyl-D-glutamate--2,6-diaminopimelate ligase [Magnetospirillum moscoviense]|uniref:UDP-N-acetylmuramoyl-L-alanyl-D-glutamate--2,6-diaminopimelate ligase n=1 Tax=Magnetospirillum moscoviense TaxID=1437059 RepID=A0A178M8C9_9PROT|nr:UDP-N-acetylmuramoyl-L-alanyl-D-glutamate--2,6-diaminopimelate ligase [Magnetospirillum moscoviense]OAN44467.1 UDP-N-acetylmuramoyl-L-alanyl-D-glutamate--2,6-diaminopimelate ligase [Magnetospirillum moscoviense]